MKRLNLWASPRNISTAIMYSFAQRNDTTVIDEPFYAYYLHNTTVIHPAQTEILSSQSLDWNAVLKNVILKEYNTEIVFFKQMSHHQLNQSLDFLIDCENIILIRNPKEMIHSFSKVIEKPTIEDLGLKKSKEIAGFLEKQGRRSIILDSNELLKDPKTVLKKLCNRLGISFDKKMLKWETGARKEDGVWAKHWYSNVHQSNGFGLYKEKKIKLSEYQQRLYEECLPIYLDLYKHSIKV